MKHELKRVFVTGSICLTSLISIGCQNKADGHRSPAKGAVTTAPFAPTNPVKPISNYTPPDSKAQARAWKKQGFWRVQHPGDPFSPHYVEAITGPTFNVYSFDAAIKDFFDEKNGISVKFAQQPKPEPLEAWKQWDGTDMRLALAPTRYGGTNGVFFFVIGKKANSKDYILNGFEVTEETFRKWGGVTRMLALQEGIKTAEMYPKERRKAIANAPLPNQVALYEASLNALQKDLATAMVAMTQAQVLLRMQELNYDLLLGRNITFPLIGD